MTLSRKLTWKLIALTVSLLLLGGASVWGLYGMTWEVRLARDEYREMRMIQKTDIHVASVLGMFQASPPAPHAVAVELQPAIDEINHFIRFQDTQFYADPRHQAREIQTAQKVLPPLEHLLEKAERVSGAAGGDWYTEDDLRRVGEALNELERLAGIMDGIIDEAHVAANEKLCRTIVMMACLSLAIVLVAVGINVSQYRNVITPLRLLQKAARRVAEGRFQEQVKISGDEEFATLARDFNHMAGELDALYTNLEQQVRTKSAELARSERLASVGYLAAGVAHEINNPLNIISGYAELTLKKCRQPVSDESVREAKRVLELIRDEAFRCKGIIEQLLSLTRNEKAERVKLSVGDVLADVVAMVGGLKQFRRCRIRVDVDSHANLDISANEVEIKQVLLNLVVNALEAVESERDEVVLTAHRNADRVMIMVKDTGMGMTRETLERVFEPFFTERRGTQAKGVGLGLAITHAIVESYGGRIRAESEGPGRGSTFVVELPAATEADSREHIAI